jgi:hypothetical protein
VPMLLPHAVGPRSLNDILFIALWFYSLLPRCRGNLKLPYAFKTINCVGTEMMILQ